MHNARIRWFSLWGIILFVILASGCTAFEDPSKRATENAESTALSRTISAVDMQNETIIALQATADSAALIEAQLTQVVAERNTLQLTVAAIANSNNGGVVLSQPNANPTPQGGTTLDGGAPAGPGPSATPNQQPQYVDTRISSGVNANFCALNNQSTFSMGTTIVYFVAVGQNIPRGVNYSLRISQDGGVLNQDPNFWTSDDFYESTCIYYEIDENNIDFEAGAYTVELLANNISVAQATFTIN